MRSTVDAAAGRDSSDGELAREAFIEFQRTRRPQSLARVFDLVAQELLLVAHHLARRGVSPEDLVQSTFLDALRSADSYDSARPLMPWLCGILINVARRQNREQTREYDAWRFDPAGADDPAELANALEFAAALREAIAEFPSPQRDVLTLRLVHGLTPTEIAHALGHPVGSVKSWVHRGVERLRHALPATFGAALASYASADQSLAEQRERLLERASDWLANSTDTTVVTAKSSAGLTRSFGLWGALVLTLSSCWFAWRAFHSEPQSPSAPLGGLEGEQADARSAAESSLRREAHSTPVDSPAVNDGALEVVAHFASDGAPAELALRLTPRWGADPSFRELELRTDSTGVARAQGLARGTWELRADRCAPQLVELGPHGARVELTVAAGVLVRGRAVDSHGAALRGARVWLSDHDSLNGGQFVATTLHDGSFELRDVPAERAVAVHAQGFAPSSLLLVSSLGAEAASFTLNSERRGLRGRVVSEHGEPLAGARVLVGALIDARALATLQAGHELVAPMTLVCDEHGEFAADWLPQPWTAPIRARAAGFAALEQSGPVDEALKLELAAGSVWRGTLDSPTFAAGVVALRVESIAAAAHSPQWLTPRWLGPRHGAFELGGVGPGARVLTATDSSGRSCSSLAPPPLEGVITWSPDCGGPAPLRGVVRGHDGAPLEGAQIEALRLGASSLQVTSDAAGEFAFDDLGAGGATLITRRTPGGCVIDRRVGVRGGGERLEIVVPPERLPTAFIAVRARDSEDRELGEAYMFSRGRHIPAAVERRPDGGLRVGPLPAGSFHLLVQGEGAELLHLGPVELEPLAELDVGAHVSAPPGRLEVVVADLPQADRGSVGALLLAPDGGCMLTVFKLNDGRGTCLPTAPGDWLLRVSFPQLGLFEAQVQVAPGELTRLALAAPTGAAVTFAIGDAALDESLALQGRIECLDTAKLQNTTPSLRRSPSDGLRRTTRNLTPGRYRIELDDGFALRGSAVFAVGAGVEQLEVPVEMR